MSMYGTLPGVSLPATVALPCPPAPTAPTRTAKIAEAAADGDKPVSTLVARLALAGFQVHRLDGGGYLVCRWNLSRHCPDMRTLAGFAQQLGVRA